MLAVGGGGDVCRKRIPPAVLGKDGFQNPDREASIREVGSLPKGRVGGRGSLCFAWERL